MRLPRRVKGGVAFAALKYLWRKPDETGKPKKTKYEPYGVVVTKPWAYQHNARPVLYLSDEEMELLCIPKDERWRVVKLEKEGKFWISWLHEREWRCPDHFKLPSNPLVLVKTAKDVAKLQDALAKGGADFKCRPRAILPLHVICQGIAG